MALSTDQTRRPRPGQESNLTTRQPGLAPEPDNERIQAEIEAARKKAITAFSPQESLTSLAPTARKSADAALVDKLLGGEARTGQTAEQAAARVRVNLTETSTGTVLGSGLSDHIDNAADKRLAQGRDDARHIQREFAELTFPSPGGLNVSALGRMLLDQFTLLQGQGDQMAEGRFATRSARLSLTQLVDGIASVMQRYAGTRTSADPARSGPPTATA